eukprot:scaffold302_cov247-Pinguiococcus_pyrenoidosus.AAC.16
MGKGRTLKKNINKEGETSLPLPQPAGPRPLSLRYLRTCPARAWQRPGRRRPSAPRRCCLLRFRRW